MMGPSNLVRCRSGAGPGLRENFDTSSSQQLQAEMMRTREELQAPMEEARRLQAGRGISAVLGLDVGSSSAPDGEGGNMAAPGWEA